MTESTARPPRRVAVAVSGQIEQHLLADLLHQLALAPGDELRGLFIEDSDLLKAAALPFTVEFCAVTSVCRPIDRARVEAALHAAALSTERFLARVAAEVGLTWHFEIVREKRRVAMFTALGATDTLVLPAAAEQAGEAAPATLVALVDASEAGSRALELARAIANAQGARLAVYRDGGDFTDEHGRTLSAAALAARLRRPAPRLIVVAAPLLHAEAQALLELCEGTPAPLVIVR